MKIPDYRWPEMENGNGKDKCIPQNTVTRIAVIYIAESID
jgi:hypothetical protein